MTRSRSTGSRSGEQASLQTHLPLRAAEMARQSSQEEIAMTNGPSAPVRSGSGDQRAVRQRYRDRYRAGEHGLNIRSGIGMRRYEPRPR